MSNRKTKFILWLFALILVMACVPTLSSAPSVATLDPAEINRIVMQTANAASTQTAAAFPTTTPTEKVTITSTSTPTDTPEPTATNTFIFILSSPTSFVIPTFTSVGGSGTSTANYACQVLSVSPANGTSFASRTDFDGKWRVKNIGKKDWDGASVDYIYDKGDKFHKVSGYNLGKTIKVGETTDLIVDMEAPKNSGTYTTFWTMTVGSKKFCSLTLTIFVK